MRKLALLFLLAGIILSNLNAQRNCSAMDNLKHLIKIYPTISQEMQGIERHTQDFLKNARLRSNDDKIITIPVVVHLLFNTTSENISDQIVRSQLQVLNEDFRRLNADQTKEWNQATDARIEFKLAKFAPNGNPTNGINRKFTPNAYFHPNNQMKFAKYGGADAWPADQYLNIWVCDLLGNKMGYGQFPGGPKATDGVVIDYDFFGSTSASSKYGLGRTTTHEVGHWLNLRHIWGDLGCGAEDLVHDTPTAAYPSYGCQTGKVSCGSLDMVSNFMDYSYDRCMNLFTEGQKARMRALFSKGGSREPLLYSHALGTPEGVREEIVQEEPECDHCGAAEEETPEVCVAPQNISLQFDGRSLIASWEGPTDHYLFELKPSFSTKWFSFIIKSKTITIGGVSANIEYDIRIKTICEDGTESAAIDASRLSGMGDRKGNETLRFVNPAVGVIHLQWSPDFFSQAAIHQKQDSRLIVLNSTSIDPFKDAPEKTAASIRKIKLYDLSGRLVVNTPVRLGTYSQEIPVQHLQTGLYIMAFVDGKDQILHRTKVNVQASR